MGLIDIATAAIAGFRNFVLAYACIYMLYDEENPYPAFGPAKELKLSWMMPIIIRDLIATAVICGFWDWFLYFSPAKEKLHKYKINHIYPSMHQIKHDAGMCSNLAPQHHIVGLGDYFLITLQSGNNVCFIYRCMCRDRFVSRMGNRHDKL